LELILTEKKEVKQCFNCGSIEPINEYQKNGKTPRGRQKYRQECRECREERREKERENREKQKIKDQEAREEREREAERQRVRRREPKKICKVCGKKKPISEYQKNGKTPRGRQKYRQECRECRQDQEKIRIDRQTRELNEGTQRIREQAETMRGLYNALKPGKKKG
jgi:cellulose biosynthesis protein BcsQ